MPENDISPIPGQLDLEEVIAQDEQARAHEVAAAIWHQAESPETAREALATWIAGADDDATRSRRKWAAFVYMYSSGPLALEPQDPEDPEDPEGCPDKHLSYPEWMAERHERASDPITEDDRREATRERSEDAQAYAVTEVALKDRPPLRIGDEVILKSDPEGHEWGPGRILSFDLDDGADNPRANVLWLNQQGYESDPLCRDLVRSGPTRERSEDARPTMAEVIRRTSDAVLRGGVDDQRAADAAAPPKPSDSARVAQPPPLRIGPTRERSEDAASPRFDPRWLQPRPGDHAADLKAVVKWLEARDGELGDPGALCRAHPMQCNAPNPCRCNNMAPERFSRDDDTLAVVRADIQACRSILASHALELDQPMTVEQVRSMYDNLGATLRLVQKLIDNQKEGM